ncbi:translation initiation factor IF-2, mitochondrial [[Candida] jaroonii]|uniref:Translation initiation factor IF-2, mitochondrial n=1 Tax=[Candida] jaroonii TaxID=467808 RepID=A0ACA9Y2T7_9ASCO|nr:translation initiation factor IF-2, mitochondrial [[Candida] jaroonii]
MFNLGVRSIRCLPIGRVTRSYSILNDLPKVNRFADKYKNQANRKGKPRTDMKGDKIDASMRDKPRPRNDRPRNDRPRSDGPRPIRLNNERSRPDGPKGPNNDRTMKNTAKGSKDIKPKPDSNAADIVVGFDGPYDGQDERTKYQRKMDAAAKAKEYQKVREALKAKQQKQAVKTPKPKEKPRKKETSKAKVKISVPTFITVGNLSSMLNIPLNKLLQNLESMGFENMRHNYILDKENVSLIADEYGFEISMNDDSGLDLFPAPEPKEGDVNVKSRAPIITIMGHVDHGKTTILDHLRKSSIVDKEFGGITQHIGAFSVITPISKKKITFLDTPGHSAFLKMRERGANVTDIVILVVAADDSVMPQTIEAIKHSKKAGVPIIVAINKCDKPGVNVDKVLGDLARYDIDIEDYGGDTQTVQVSGKTGLNMDKLEEAVITLSELNDFKAETKGVPSEGWIIESEVMKGMGPVSTILVTRSSVKVGDFLVAGKTYCKVRGMKDEHGKMVKIAGPSTPVQIWGWKELPTSGDQVLQATNEQIAKKVVQNRITREKEMMAFKDIEIINSKRQKELEELAKQEKINELKQQGFSEEDLKEEFEQEAKIKTVNYIIKSDVFGSAEAIKESIEGLGNDEVKAVVISHDAGPPVDSDIDMASTLNAKIFCFNVKIPKSTSTKANQNNVEMKEHNIIYRLIEEVTEDLNNQLEPVVETKILSEAKIQGIFNITVVSNGNKRKVKIAGCKVNSGTLHRNSTIRVMRNDTSIYEGSLSTMKHNKDDVKEIKNGIECGLSFDNWDKFEEGDVIQAFELIHHKRYL